MSLMLPLLGGLFIVLAIGALLRAKGGLGVRDADLLNRLIIDVTMPALVFRIMVRAEIGADSGKALLASTVALVVSFGLGLLCARLLHLGKQATGSAALTVAFCNTGFLGVPLIENVFAGDAAAASAAVVIDTVNTTLLLWTLGVAFAEQQGGMSSGGWRAGLVVFVRRPLVLAAVAGVVCRALHVPIPAFVLSACTWLGAATPALVFLSLGLTLDVKALRGRVGSVVVLGFIKLLASPLVAVGVCLFLDVHGSVGATAVLQSAMPTALASTIVAARAGCDRDLAAGVAAFTTLGALATLPLWAAVALRFLG